VAWIANAVLIVHVLFVLFVVGGLVFVWIGHWRGWPAARNRRFRVLHLCAIAFVALETIAGIACPLTVWEYRLRGGEGIGEDFIARWLHRLLYYDFPAWVFSVAYVAFAAVVAATWLMVPPDARKAPRR
jgi:hypothetical protein